MEADSSMDRQQPAGCKFPAWLPARYVFAVLGSIGFAIIYGLKVNLSVCIVAMINSTALTSHSDVHSTDLLNATGAPAGEMCVYPTEDLASAGTKGAFQTGRYEWNERIQGLVLGSYFWGYLVTQVPGGRVAEMFSGKWVMYVAVLINVLFTVLTPIAADLGYGALIAARVAEGLGAGVTFPAMHVMIAKWTPPFERSKISAIVYAGTALGTVISMPMSGLIAGWIGWEAVFYIMGALASLWCLLWPVLVFDSPQTHPLISQEERTLIITSLEGDAPKAKHESNAPVPWRAVLTSGPFLAILVAHFCSNFGWYMLLIELPSYMKQVLRFDIQQNAGLSALPFFTMWVFGLVFSNRLDWARSKGFFSTTAARKLATAIASVVPAICLVGVCFAGCNRTWAVALMTVGITAIAGMFSGFLSNHIDISPNYAGTLMALTNTAATIPGFIVPVFVGELTHGNQSLGQWQIIFFTTVGFYAVEVITYSLLGSGETQPWNEPKNKYDAGNGDGETEVARL
ncbi:sialin [Neocloeon triangulifer]|uniref:sialin n=1 Tax=Neocloeon triangulifer TaxID=2078957 RepID=UPI00286F1740|nr:sialin [Neocloeon triangulifer]